MVTLKEIATVCGVSVASVSKALNFAPDIGVQTAERIRRTAAEMGYHPNAAARALKTNRSHSIGVLFSAENHGGLAHEYFVHVLNAINSAATASGYDVVFISHRIGANQMSYLEHCSYRNCDGVVVANMAFDDPEVVELAESKVPTVTIDHVFPGCSAVLSDNRKGLYDLVRYAQSLGHRKIAYIYGEDTFVTQQRVLGFRDAYAEAGMEIPEGYLLESRYHEPARSGELTRKLLAMPDPPTCILYPGDVSLMGGINELEHRGVRVPEDISVIGYDGIPLSRLMRPHFTTMCQDSAQLGARAVALLIDQIENSDRWKPVQEIIPGSLQLGGTAAPYTGK